MFPTPINNGGAPVSAQLYQHQHQHQHQHQPHRQHSQHGQDPQQSDSLDTQLQHLHLQHAQLEAMRILQQQHMLPNIVAPKQDDVGLLHNPPSGPWSCEDYDSMMRTILDATLPSDHFADLEAPAPLVSFSASYAGSFVSGSSDSGASPTSINDLVYGAPNFPTPPDSDFGSSARNMSFSLASHNGTAFSPDSSLNLSNASYANSYSGSDTTSPYAHNFNMHASSSTSPFGLRHVRLPSTSVAATSASPLAASQLGDPSAPMNPHWNPNFLAPNTTGLPQLSHHESTDLSSPSTSNDANDGSRKRRVSDVNVSATKAPVKSAAKKLVTPAAPESELAEDARKAKKAKRAVTAIEPKVASTGGAAPISHLSRKLPHMEVGSNATALAAIERLKAKRLQESHAAAVAKAANASAAGSGSSQEPGFTTATDKPILDPATRQQKKVAHNAIERRYRNNINDRIAALRRAVPALREIRPRKTPSGRRSRKAQQEEDLVDGVPAATKLNKATILGKATDYIKYLKSRELRLNSEVAGLRELVRSLEGGEELLELWEAEMDKVVAEQEALAAAAAAQEEEEAEETYGNAEGEDDDEDDDDVDDDETADTGESSYNSASSSSPPSARSRTGSKAGRGRKSGIAGALSSLASSRYMLATFLGISFIGSGTEFALDATASDSSQAVGRPAAGHVLVGASRQMLKRSAIYMAPTTSIAQESHVFDAVPTHALAFEVLRIISFSFCFLFLVWPLVSRLISFKSRSASLSDFYDDSEVERSVTQSGRSRRLRLALTKGEIDVATFDTSMRTQISAPTSAVLATPALIVAGSRLALSRAARLQKLIPAQRLPNEEAAALARLLEVETLCEGKAQSSALLRLHTALRLTNSEHVRSNNCSTSRDPVLAAPRLKATLALTFARLGEGVDSAQDLADQLWNEARASLRNTPLDDSSAPSALDKDDDLVASEDASWLSSVLSLDLDSALDLLASASSKDARDCEFSAVLAIADVYYCSRLASVWSRLLASLVRASCPSAESPTSLFVRDFVSLQSKQRLDLDVIRDATIRKDLHSEITSLARTAPPTARAWQMAQVTLATWSAVLGNLALTLHVASILHEHPFATEGNVRLASVHTLDSFVDAAPAAATFASAVVMARDELDGKANLFLSWLRFLRTFADVKTSAAELHAATLDIRKLVAAFSNAVNVDADRAAVAELSGDDEPTAVVDELESSLDLITDLCTALGRRINRLPKEGLGSGSVVKLLTDALRDDDGDSGVEV